MQLRRSLLREHLGTTARQQQLPSSAALRNRRTRPRESEVTRCGKLLALYAFLYTCVATYFVVAMSIFLHGIIMQEYPHLQGPNSLLASSGPGLSIVPQPDYLTTLIRMKFGKKYTYRKYMDDMTAFLQNYDLYSAPPETSYEDCVVNERNLQEISNRVSCRYNLNRAGPCNSYYDFGYEDGTPCVILKMNRVYGWLPQPPSNVTTSESTGILVKCQGATDVDDELIGPLCYYDDDFTLEQHNSGDCPKTEFGEFKHYYFPFVKQSNYHSPLVFLEFQGPTRYVTLHVECFLMGDNVDPKEGRVSFELLVL